jgi:transcription initiation factor IIE alpha subunit
MENKMSKAKYEEKFIVINVKHLEKIPYTTKEFLLDCLDTAKEYLPSNKYYVCNQDEPYANRVIDIILKGESNKHKKQGTIK